LIAGLEWDSTIFKYNKKVGGWAIKSFFLPKGMVAKRMLRSVLSGFRAGLEEFVVLGGLIGLTKIIGYVI
jgi:hypothetical protein